jgi:hypothetical protein
MNAVVVPETLMERLRALPQAHCPVRHLFGPGVYMRELSAKACTVIIGRKQLTRHKCILVRGRLTFLNDDATVTTLEAPLEFMAEPGRKVARVDEDMTFVNVYETDETDVETLEAMLLEPLPGKLPLLGGRDAAYLNMLEGLGVTEEAVRRLSVDDTDLIPFPFGCYKVKVGRSQIEGKGLIATADIEAGELIGPASIEGRRTPAGRYTNHSDTPNAKMVETQPGLIDLVASRFIAGSFGGEDGEEVTVDYRLTPQSRLEAARCRE